jgi:hypothetical protein
VIPISKKIVQLVLRARYDGSDNVPKSAANGVTVSNQEARKYSSEFTCAWSMRTAFQLLDLPNNANHQDIISLLRVHRKSHKSQGKGAFKVSRDLEALYSWIFESEGTNGCNWCFLEKIMIWSMILISIVLGSRGSQTTIYSIECNQLQFSLDPKHVCAAGLPLTVKIEQSKSKVHGLNTSRDVIFYELWRNRVDSRYCPVTALFQWLFYSRIIDLIGLENQGPIYRKINVAADIKMKYGDPTVALDLYPVRSTDKGSSAVPFPEWYSESFGAEKQSLTVDYFFARLKLGLKQSIHEEVHNLTLHCFRKHLFDLVAQCHYDSLHATLTGDWAFGSISQMRYIGLLDDMTEFENDPASDPMFRFFCWHPVRCTAMYSRIAIPNLPFRDSPLKRKRDSL